MGISRRIIAILSVCGHDGADADLGADRGCHWNAAGVVEVQPGFSVTHV